MNAKIFTALAALFGVGLIGGYVLRDVWDARQTTATAEMDSTSRQVRQMGQYTYTNPLLECEVAEGTLDARKENFHDALEKYVRQLKIERKLSDVAVYFRDLNNGPTFGIGERGEFFPASLLKVPIMMAYYHLAEQNPSILGVEIRFEKPVDFDITPTILPRESLVVGESYTVDDLVRRMIVYSDNQALSLLSARLPLAVLQDLFAMLDVGGDVLADSEAKLTVKEYAGFFRILFNSSYLSRNFSEKALALLAKTDYADALPAGVPSDMMIAHKFGEAGTEDAERQLHDCGIVYFPDHPYLACIMTRGSKAEDLKDTIVDVSKFIYEKIDEQY
ncbi:MAG: serine hydrolase [Candidatus Moraniibacteriota bacterium]|nr:MAG: serine hydrolase [Candidatus Moranbacteria bacterium]